LIHSNKILINQSDSSFSQVAFEKIYLEARQKENRIYSDEQVAGLPYIERSHIHFKEWSVRKRSAYRLVKYLNSKKKPLVILEVGCGNGWLCGMMADLKNSTVIGNDINNLELNQAKRVFYDKSGLKFESGDWRNMESMRKFDIIIFAASIQYFPSFDNTITMALSFLKPDGEIHILDSRFYDPGELEQARQRSQIYYESLGKFEMTKYYFHHVLDSLNGFKYKTLFNPDSFISKIIFTKDPFPWICITPG
jgi:SAM-dependent methyltransferase